MQEPHWTELEGSDRARECLATGEALWCEGASYRSACREALRRYHGTAELGYETSNGQSDQRPLAWGMTRSMVSTVVSRIGALQAPRAQFVTSDAEWGTRRKASKLDDFFDALALQECHPYTSVHDLRIAILQDAALMGRGWAQLSADPEGARIVTERVLPWEVCYDSRDARYGCPREWWRVYPIGRMALAAAYPEHAQQIESAQAATEDGVSDAALDWYASGFSRQDRVQVYECWRVAVGEDEGRHVIGIHGQSGDLLLLDEEWEFEGPPLVSMQWDHAIVGARGLSLADEVRTSEDAVNEHLWRMQNAIRRTSVNTLLAMDGAVIDGDTVDTGIIRYTGAPPQLYSPPPFDASHMQWAQTLWGKAFELTGIGQMAATGERQPGMTSGAAIRASASQQDLRFAWLTRQQGDFIVQWARWGNRLLGKLAADGVDVMARVPGATSMRRVEYRSLELGEDDFLVQVHPVSESKGSPAARLEEAEELLQRGLLTPQQYAAATSGSLDTPYWRKWSTRQEELVDCYIERWMDATPEDVERVRANGGYWDEERGIPMVPTPEMWMDIGAASVQVALSYMEAQMESAPDYVLQYMRTFLAGCDLVAKKIAESAAPPPPPPTEDGPAQGAPGPIHGEPMP